ncbi:odorant receptor 59b-like [Drosophila virilis]|uniref:odorant receptor 59b-like n=1 Tax=Drosophila virilis TaxID=7244 RepID=UPI0038B26BBC
MPGIFKLTTPAPLAAPIRSREGCAYLYRIMKFVGWIPPEHGWRRYLYQCWACIVFASSTFCLPLGLLFSLILDSKNFTPGEFLGVLQMCSNLFGTSLKNIFMFFYLTRLHETRSILDTLDERLHSNSDRRKIHKAVADSNYIFMVYFNLYLGYTISDVIAGVVNNQPPWLAYNPFFDWRSGKDTLWMQIILEFSAMILTASIILIMDTYTILFLYIFRAHMDVLKDHIRSLRTDPLKKEAESYDELVGCITYHKSILRCCELLRPVMSFTIFIQFLLIGIVLGFTLINILYFSGLLRGLSSVMFFANVLIQTFPFCYLCDLLVDDCADLANLLAQSNWIDAGKKYKSTLKIFMQHVQKPIIFIAGGLFPISLNSNIKVAKFAFSVMTIVQQMDLAARFK